MSTVETHTPAGPDAGGTVRLNLGGKDITIERPSGRKASQALALIRAVSKAAPEIQKSMARFTREYEAENVVELDRVQARLQFPARPLVDEEGQPVLDEHGAPTMIPGRTDAMTDEDWERAGNVLRMKTSPSTQEVVLAILDEALELAEDHVYRLLALFTLSNSDVARYRKEDSLGDKLTEASDALLDEMAADDLVELAVVCGEVVDRQFRQKALELGARMGNALRLVGLDWTPASPSTPTTSDSPSADAPLSDGPTTSTPNSSIETPRPTDGTPTPPSTSPGIDSSGSPSSPSATTSEKSTSENGNEPSVTAT